MIKNKKEKEAAKHIYGRDTGFLNHTSSFEKVSVKVKKSA
jgi:hypothetical protein